MKLYLKQKFFSLKDKFHIYDVNENEQFHAESDFFTFGKKLHLYDNNGEELSFIHQKVFSFLPRYFISIGGEDAAEVVKKFTFIKQKYEIAGPGWTVDGNFMAHEYTISKGSEVIATISKKWLTWGDTYEIDINNSADTVMVLSVILVIDAVMAQQSAAASAAASSN